MIVNLLPESQRRVEALLSTGEFASAAEVLEAALAAFEETEDPQLDQETLDAIDEAEAEIERGEGVPWEVAREGILAIARGEKP
jgi:Arc/MetJ-type ribon-helix-helix transcriptional regulator